MVDKEIKGGDILAGKIKSTNKNTFINRTDNTTYFRKIRNDLLHCIGDVCFPIDEHGNQIIEINIDQDKNPECAELLSEIIPKLKTPVRFNLKKVAIGLEITDKGTKD